MKLAHIVNPLVTKPGSDLGRAQPLTLESMRLARTTADEVGIAVRQYAAFYPEDRAAVPDAFGATAVLERSIIDLVPSARRKLPLLADLLVRLYDAAPDADYLIYSNIDIGLRPDFYVAVAHIIDQGSDAFVIGRSTVGAKPHGSTDLDHVLAQPGTPRPGFSCFVFPRAHCASYDLDDTCIGVQPVGVTLVVNLIQHAQNFRNLFGEPLTFHVGDDGAWRSAIFDDVHLHNERALDRVVARLGNGLTPRAAEVLETYQRWRSDWVIERCSSRAGRIAYRIARRAGFTNWVGARYDRID